MDPTDSVIILGHSDLVPTAFEVCCATHATTFLSESNDESRCSNLFGINKLCNII